MARLKVALKPEDVRTARGTEAQADLTTLTNTEAPGIPSIEIPGALAAFDLAVGAVFPAMADRGQARQKTGRALGAGYLFFDLGYS